MIEWKNGTLRKLSGKSGYTISDTGKDTLAIRWQGTIFIGMPFSFEVTAQGFAPHCTSRVLELAVTQNGWLIQTTNSLYKLEQVVDSKEAQ